jgi:hypothetical protein
MDGAVARGFTSDLVLFDQGEDVFGCRAEPFHEPRAVGRPQRLTHRRGGMPDTGIHEADVPA